MALYTIADLHLSLGADKPMNIFPGWEGYMERIESNWRKIVRAEDTVVLPGDLSWAMSLKEAHADFAFLHSLPGTKIVGKGNHDYWWSTKRKMDQFFEENGFDSIHILHNNAYAANGCAVCGTRGWFFDAEQDQDNKILRREAGRLETSIDEGIRLGLEPVVFLHYPPVFANAECEEILSVLQKKQVCRVFYGHIHGQGIHKAITGDYGGLKLRLISCDAVGFMPVLVQ